MKNKTNTQKYDIYRYSASLSGNRGYNYSKQPSKTSSKKRIPFTRHILFLIVIFAFIIFSLTFVISMQSSTSSAPNPNNQAAILGNQYCMSNKLSKLVIVSISRRHLWACNMNQDVFNSAVITGNENLASDLTPVGHYQVFGKYTNQNLIGSNAYTSWDDHVSYWMPFLQNQYGQYGFHDATWRSANEFGNISPYTSNASHGCVECPLTTAAWLYNWVNVGTNVSIIN